MSTDPLPVSAEAVIDLEQACRRVVSARIANPADRDDLTQEAVTRSLAAHSRLTDAGLLPYGVTVARNLCTEHLAAARRDQARRHRLYERPTHEDPGASLLRLEEQAAVVATLAKLRQRDRELLIGHVLDGQPLTTSEDDESPGARAARLGRTRARARVEFVLAARRQHLPSRQCRPVLLAISAADRRRQDALDAPEHLAVCPVCPTLIAPLATRRGALAGLLPLPFIAALSRRAGATTHPAVAAGTAAAGLVLVLGGGVVLAAHHKTAVPPAAGLRSPAAAPYRTPPVALPEPLGVCYFADASAALTAACRTTIAHVAAELATHHVRRVTVTGSTDRTGDPNANSALARRRAETVATALRQHTAIPIEVKTSPPSHASGPQPHDRQAVIT